MVLEVWNVIVLQVYYRIYSFKRRPCNWFIESFSGRQNARVTKFFSNVFVLENKVVFFNVLGSVLEDRNADNDG